MCGWTYASQTPRTSSASGIHKLTPHWPVWTFPQPVTVRSPDWGECCYTVRFAAVQFILLLLCESSLFPSQHTTPIHLHQSPWHPGSLSSAPAVSLHCLPLQGLPLTPIVSGLSAAHTIYLSGGNVILLDKNSKRIVKHITMDSVLTPG